MIIYAKHLMGMDPLSTPMTTGTTKNQITLHHVHRTLHNDNAKETTD